jgi:hypothetical protein
LFECCVEWINLNSHRQNGGGGGGENGPIDDTLTSKDEGFIPFNNEDEEPIVIPPMLPIVLLPPLPIVNPPMGKWKVLSTFLLVHEACHLQDTLSS